MGNYQILFVSSLVSTSNTGGSLCSKRNYESLLHLFGKENVFCYTSKPFRNVKFSFKSIFNVFLNTVNCRVNGIMKEDENNILSLIKDNNIPYVFIDYSANGKLVKLIKKKTEAKVISFFHNCELSIAFQQIISNEIWGIFRLYSCYLGEKLTCKYADYIIGLNYRDDKIIDKFYHRHFNIIIPISLFDKYSKTKCNGIKVDVLFIGSNFYPNLHGIKWFINKVLPYVDKTLTIIGRNLSPMNLSPRITLLSNVDDLNEFYNSANIVIAPIFRGAGMKVKIAEAMMYNKIILGTSEAFQGYKIVDGMIECNSASDFIKAINNPLTYTIESKTRDCFLSTYSFESTLPLFFQVFKNL